MFGDVASANVVGYQNAPAHEGDFNFMTMTFDKVGGGSTIKLSDLKVGENFIYSYVSFFNPATGGDRKFKYDENGVCVQDNNGDFFGKFTWWTKDDLAGVGITGEDGWYSEDDMFTPHPVQDFEIAFGEGFYVRGQDDGDANLLHSGEVIGEAQPLEVAEGDFNFRGNCTPTPINLSDLGGGDNFIYSYVSFFNPTTGGDRKFKYDENGVCIQDDNGDFFGKFTWWTSEDLSGVGITGEDGWYSEDDMFTPHPVQDFEINPGEGLYVRGQDDGSAYLMVPSPL